MKGDIGSGFVAAWPPAITMGCESPRSEERTGIPDKSRIFKALV
jgi:hypothetical protein